MPWFPEVEGAGACLGCLQLPHHWGCKGLIQSMWNRRMGNHEFHPWLKGKNINMGGMEKRTHFARNFSSGSIMIHHLPSHASSKQIGQMSLDGCRLKPFSIAPLPQTLPWVETGGAHVNGTPPSFVKWGYGSCQVSDTGLVWPRFSG